MSKAPEWLQGVSISGIALTEKQTKIIEHIISNGRITSSEIQKMFKTSRQAAQAEIQSKK
ncbi:MAG: hypothetical protein SCH70_04165 [Candidatus Methanoperedens sp.]|nr:hypothetical protein [Candidatus Methanoperedens sp.]